MKLCIPVEADNKMESKVCLHFGSAPVFILYDTETNDITSVNNNNLHHSHGMCEPLKALNNEAVDAILVGGIGARAIMKLNEMKIKVYRSNDGSLQQNIDLFKNGQLDERLIKGACGGHHGGECSH